MKLYILALVVFFTLHSYALNKQLQNNLIDDANELLTTDFGTGIFDDNDSLTGGVGGPTLLQDFILREKIQHFDHERIPERVVHARGSAAYGYFQPYSNFSPLTRADFLHDPTEKTPVFVRFSTVLGSLGSFDTARDPRGFAVRFYTKQGNFDLVGNNIPVFFIQDAMKFPDLIHAGKPEPRTGFPQAATAHDTAWDFLSLTPESTHMVLWVLSDRAIPRSYRMMEGFGIHTFLFVNVVGHIRLVKFHFKPKTGLAGLVWDEAQKIGGKNSDFHRIDLHEAIEKGNFPEWEFGVQVVTPEQAKNFLFDVLDPTKIIPEDLVPVTPLGRLVLDRNPDNFFAETEQVTFDPGNLVSGIEFSNDPLLQGRLFSYLDTQLSRHNSPNYLHIPVNLPLSPVHNNNRDGAMQTNIYTSRTNYKPNSLSDNFPKEPTENEGGYVTPPTEVSGRKIRARPELFSDHFSQAQLFWNSLTPVEQQHVVDAAWFELGKVETQAIRERMVDLLNHVDHSLAERVSYGINVTVPEIVYPNPGLRTSGISMEEYPKTNIITRHVAILVTERALLNNVKVVASALQLKGVYVDYISTRIGEVAGDEDVKVKSTFLTTSSVLFDAVLVAGGDIGELLGKPFGQDPSGFVYEAYFHFKPIAALGNGTRLLNEAGVPFNDGSGVQQEKGVITLAQVDSGGLSELTEKFEAAILQARFWERRELE